MKNTFLVAGLAMLLVLSVLIGLTIFSESSRANELENVVDTAAQQTLTNLKINKQYDIDNEDEFVADFVENIIVAVNSDSEIKVNILAVDIEKGLLDVEVIETYKTPIGVPRSYKVRKTIILDRIDESNADIVISFMTDKVVDGECEIGAELFYQEKIKIGDIIQSPEAFGKGVPSKDGYTFIGWVDEVPDARYKYTIDDCIDFDGLTADEDVTLYAVFSKN